ncbi:MAG: hypothetical protein ACD_51C00007G0002, partial [uncultured bacterium]
MQSQFLAAVNQLADEKNLPKEMVLDIVKSALRTAYRKDYGNKDQNVDVELNEKTEEVKVFVVREVVKSVENPEAELTLARAKKIKKNAKIGDLLKEDVTPVGYGRIAA